jgi:hypothetical protein
MGLKSKLQRIEKQADKHFKNLPPPTCPECGIVIKWITVCDGEWHLFKGGEPCSICDARPRRHLREGDDALEEDRKRPVGLAEYLRADARKPITRIYVTCSENPPEVPDLDNLKAADVLQAPDGTLYRSKDSWGS